MRLKRWRKLAILHVLKVKNDTYLDLYREILYVARYEIRVPNYVVGFNVTPQSVIEEMTRVKMCYGDNLGNQFYHLVISLEQSEKKHANLNKLVLLAQLLGVYLCDNYSLGRTQVLLAMHRDTDKDHFHAIINNMDLNTCRRLNIDKKTLYTIKKDISVILQSCGYNPVRYFQEDKSKNE